MTTNTKSKNIKNLNTKIRHLEIELDFVENSTPNDFIYIKKLNKQINELLNELTTLEKKEESNEVN